MTIVDDHDEDGAMSMREHHLVVAAGSDKAFPASVRRCQEDTIWTSVPRMRAKPSTTLDQLNRCALDRHNHSFQTPPSRVNARVEWWRNLPPRAADLPPGDEIDWRPGAWPHAWEKEMAPAGRRYFHKDTFDGAVWLLTTPPITDDDDLQKSIFADHEAAIQTYRACFPVRSRPCPRRFAHSAEL